MAENPYESPKEPADVVRPYVPLARLDGVPITAMVSSACAGVSFVLSTIHVLRELQREKSEGFAVYAGLSIALLLIFLGTLFRLRFVLRWSRVATVLIAVAYTYAIAALLFAATLNLPGAARFDIYLGLLYAIPMSILQWTLLCSLGFQSARIYFGLACPNCGEEGASRANPLVGRTPCERCGEYW